MQVLKLGPETAPMRLGAVFSALLPSRCWGRSEATLSNSLGPQASYLENGHWGECGKFQDSGTPGGPSPCGKMDTQRWLRKGEGRQGRG